MNWNAFFVRIDKRLRELEISEAGAGERAGKTDAIRNIRRRYAKGQTGATVSTIEAVAAALKIPMGELLGDPAAVNALHETALRRTLELEFLAVEPQIDRQYLHELVEIAVAAARGTLLSPNGLNFDDSVYLSIGRARGPRDPEGPKRPPRPNSP